MGASVLPIAVHRNQIYFLFGKERDIDENPGWSDFGGGTDHDESFRETAIREGAEELSGFLGGPDQIRKWMDRNQTFSLNYKSSSHGTYRVYIVPLTYNTHMVRYFNQSRHFLQKRLPTDVVKNTKLFEKTEIRWIPYHALESMKPQFRSFYQNIVEMLIKHKDKIGRFVRGACRKHTIRCKHPKYQGHNNVNNLFGNHRTRANKKHFVWTG